jgi:hypothetical protein
MISRTHAVSAVASRRALLRAFTDAIENEHVGEARPLGA